MLRAERVRISQAQTQWLFFRAQKRVTLKARSTLSPAAPLHTEEKLPAVGPAPVRVGGKVDSGPGIQILVGLGRAVIHAHGQDSESPSPTCENLKSSISSARSSLPTSAEHPNRIAIAVALAQILHTAGIFYLSRGTKRQNNRLLSGTKPSPTKCCSRFATMLK